MTWYALLIAAVAVERVAELVVSQRNLSWSRARGGVEFGAGHYPAMVRSAHRPAGGMPGRGRVHRPFLPALGWPMLVVVLAAQGLRWWCIATLGRQWNTRVVVVPDAGAGDRRPVPVFSAPELCRGRRRRDRAAVGAFGVGHRCGVHRAQRFVLRTRISVENAALARLR